MLGADVIGQAEPALAIHYLLYDGHGSVRGLLDASGATVSTASTPQIYNYDAFGVSLANGVSANNAATRLQYSGEWWDAGLQMSDNRARLYNVSTGRFPQRDTYEGTIDDPESLHRYLYTSHDPVMGVDPSGNRLSLLEAVAVTGLIGFLALSTYLSVSMVRGTVQGTQHRFEAAGGIGGYCIDVHFASILSDVRKRVRVSTPEIRSQIRGSFDWSNAFSGAVNSWDIEELMVSGFHSPSSNILNAVSDPSRYRDFFSTGNSLPGTVTWQSSVWDADDVNYYFFGVLVRSLDDADNTSTFQENFAKVVIYRAALAQGDKVRARAALFADGYNGRAPGKDASVGGPVTPSTQSYGGSLTYTVKNGDRVILTHTSYGDE